MAAADDIRSDTALLQTIPSSPPSSFAASSTGISTSPCRRIEAIVAGSARPAACSRLPER